MTAIGPCSTLAAVQQSTSIIDKVESFLRRYIFFTDDRLYLLVAVWTLATYFHRDFEYFGYLAISSPEPECGKSVLLRILDKFVFKSSGIFASQSEASLFRGGSGKTQLFDEVDTWLHMANLKAILNAGFQRDAAKVVRCDRVQQNKRETFQLAEYDAYAPRALAGIDLQRVLPLPTKTRSFLISMERRKKSERTEKFRGRAAAAEATKLHIEIQTWATQSANSVRLTYEAAPFACLNDFGERTIDISESLMSTLEAAYSGSARLDSERVRLLQAIAIAREESNTSDSAEMVFRALRKIAEHEDPVIGNATELVGMCESHGFVFGDERSVSDALIQHGKSAVSKRLNGGNPLYRYVLTKHEIDDICSRYYPDDVRGL